MRSSFVSAGLVLVTTLLTSRVALADEWAIVEDPDAGDEALLDDQEDEALDEDVELESLGAGPSGPSTGPSRGGSKGPSRGPSCNCDVPASGGTLGGGSALGLGLCAGALVLRARGRSQRGGRA